MGRILWRSLVVLAAFAVAACVALAVLFSLGGIWAGEELQALAAGDPMFRDFVLQGPAFQDPGFRRAVAMAFGAAVFVATVVPALTALPALAAAVTGEIFHVRSWMYYVLAGGASLAAIPLLAGAALEGPAQSIPASEYMTIFATAGFAGGFIYWLLAGRGA
ncbi:hypothetical protein [Methyloceanibacter sp.]|uniref:hypothetical protein n=1 Tax=Methyloceanibacter sp. TaxID=1965321 RepID=UPI002C7545CB|nr:hypothetical protein [Methyloceanibacter sp.]HML91632.1 hypothetical protein [Methyloceanibacter sp.]